MLILLIVVIAVALIVLAGTGFVDRPAPPPSGPAGPAAGSGGGSARATQCGGATRRDGRSRARPPPRPRSPLPQPNPRPSWKSNRVPRRQKRRSKSPPGLKPLQRRRPRWSRPHPPRFRDRLGRARSTLSGYLTSVRSRNRIDESTWEDLEEGLILADVGATVTAGILDDLRARVKRDSIDDPDALVDALKDELITLLQGDTELHTNPGAINVWLFVGVNGVGKTTTIGKLGRREVQAGHKVVMAAGDTFRAAAADQLETWAGRVGGVRSSGATKEATRVPSYSTPSSTPRPGTPIWCWPTRPAGCTPRPTSWRSSRRCGGWPSAHPARSPRCSWS